MTPLPLTRIEKSSSEAPPGEAAEFTADLVTSENRIIGSIMVRF